MGLTRGCSKTGCARPAVATLTYAYADRAVVVGPLATYAEPHTYDLCSRARRAHDRAPRLGGRARRRRVPRARASQPTTSLALADAVREAGRPRTNRPAGRSARHEPRGQAGAEADSGAVESGRRGHLRILGDS